MKAGRSVEVFFNNLGKKLVAWAGTELVKEQWNSKYILKVKPTGCTCRWN